MLVAPLWEESVNVQTCLGINTQPNQKNSSAGGGSMGAVVGGRCEG